MLAPYLRLAECGLGVVDTRYCVSQPVVSRRRNAGWLEAKFHYAIWSLEAGRRPAASWNLAYHLARYSSELARASRSATGLRPASDLSATR